MGWIGDREVGNLPWRGGRRSPPLLCGAFSVAEFDDEFVEDHAGVLAGGDEGFVGVEAVGHGLLELGEGEVARAGGGHFEAPGVDGAVFLFWEDGLDAGGGAVGAAV